MFRFTLTVILLLLVIAVSISAFDGNRKGFVLGGGLGFGPVAKVSVDGASDDYDKSGLALNFVIGYAWDEQNMLVFQRDAILYSEETIYGDDISIVQGFSGIGYYHYFGPVGKSFYINGGIGFQDWTSMDSDYESNDVGGGILLGGGYEFTRHVQVHGSLSFGKTKFMDVDFNHTQLMFTVSAVAF